MSDNAYYAWFLATALMVIVVVTVGTLAAADLLPRRGAAREETREETDRERPAEELSSRR